MSMVNLDDSDAHTSQAYDPQIPEAIERLYRKGAKFHLSQMLFKLKPDDLANVLCDFPEEKACDLFEFVSPPQHAALVFEEMREGHKRYLLTHCELEHMVAMLECLPDEACQRNLEDLDVETAKRLKSALNEDLTLEGANPSDYTNNTAGSLMSPRVLALPETTTAAEAIRTIQGLAVHDSVFYLYTTNAKKRLAGVCSLRRLMLAEPETTLEELENSRLVRVHVNTPLDEVARQISQYRLLAIPVVDDRGSLVGQITIDNLVDVIQDENNRAMLRRAGIGSQNNDVLAQSPLRIFMVRVPWLISAFIGYLLISAILDGFEETLSSIVQLAFFFPVVIGMSGNAGSQTGSVAVRGLALGLLNYSHFFRLLFKELAANLIQGIVYGLCLAVAAYLFFQNPLLSLTVGSALMVNITAASAIAMSLPFFFKRIGADPAIASGPLALTFIDLVGSTNYLIIAFFTFHP
ncbi:MAG: magnesium transporter [Magnetococcales bacterium]|nr:magnesium transporter [Magnetococcales bacterium]